MRIFDFKRETSPHFFNATLYIVGINVIIFFLLNVMPQLRSDFVLLPRFIIRDGLFWQPLSYMFTHFDTWHIVGNMFALLVFGLPLEERLGSKAYIIFYLLCGVGAGILSGLVYYYTGQNIAMLGASGAVFGVLLGFATYYPNMRIYIWGMLPVRSSVLVLVYTGWQILEMVTNQNPGVSQIGHLTGFLIGFFYFLIRFRVNAIKVLIDSIRNR